LNQGLELNRAVTLVSAPAGFGKTTCISEWASALDRWLVTWLSLDPSDDDPARFFAYFVAALHKVDAKLLRSLMLPSETVKVIQNGYPFRFIVFSTGSLVSGLLYLYGAWAR
jgi:ATP/maltotriose-dependent transcriptional regulator MalT